MTTCDPTALPTFEYGYLEGGVTTTSRMLGTAQGVVLPDGSMQITMPKSIVGNNTVTGNVWWHVPVGATITNIEGETYLLAGGGCHGLLEPLDGAGGTGANKYVVGGNCAVTGIERGPGAGSPAFSFRLAGPNPFHARTALTYALPERSPVRIDVYSVTGQHVAALVNQVEEAGVHTVPFEFTNSAGRRLAPGIYLVKIRAGREQANLRLVAFD